MAQAAAATDAGGVGRLRCAVPDDGRLQQLGDKSLALSLAHFAREMWLYALSALPDRSRPRRPRASACRGPRVIVIPGLMAGDRAMRPMRLALRAAGFRAYRWCLGRNTGATAELLDQLDARVRRLQQPGGEPLILVGWSLGGLIAREYAKRAPERVAAVVTLGSPFSGDIRSTIVARLYEWVAGHSIASLPVACTLSQKPPVPTAAIWSRHDGVIPAISARGLRPEADYRIEVSCAHLAFPSDPAALEAVVDAIAYCEALSSEPGVEMERAAQAA